MVYKTSGGFDTELNLNAIQNLYYPGKDREYKEDR